MAFPHDGVKFKEGESGNPAGRPRKWVTQLRDKGYKLSEVNDAIQVLIQMSEEELREVADGQNNAIIERIVAGALLASHTKKSLYNIETLLTRVYGKPKELSESKSVTKIIVEYASEDNPIQSASESKEDIE